MRLAASSTLFMLFLLIARTPQSVPVASAQDDPIRLKSDLVTLTAAVTDRIDVVVIGAGQAACAGLIWLNAGRH